MECASKGGACSPREFLQEYFPGQEKLPVVDFLKYVRSVSERPSLFEVAVPAGTEEIIEGMGRAVAALIARSSGEGVARAASVNLDLSEENSPLRVRAVEGAYVIDHGKHPVMCVRV